MFTVPSLTNKGTVYTAAFDLANWPFFCTCYDFRRSRLVCKHLLQVTVQYPLFNLEKIHSELFRNPVYRFDDTLIHSIEADAATVVSSGSCSNQPFTHEEENMMETANSNQSRNANDIKRLKLKLRGNKKIHLLNRCNSSTREIQSAMWWYLDESGLESLTNSLEGTFKEISKKVAKDKYSGLPIQEQSSSKLAQKPVCKYGKIKAHRRKISKRVGMVADMLKKAKIRSKPMLR